MIDLAKINFEYNEPNFISIIQEGNCSKGAFNLNGYVGGFEIEGSTICIKAIKGDREISQVHVTSDFNAVFNSFIEVTKNG